MAYCDKCKTMFASRQSLWKHRKRKHQEQKGEDWEKVGDIINRVVGRASMDTEPTMSVTPIKASPQKPEVKDVPIKALNAVKPKALTDLAMEIDGKTDSEDETEDVVMETDGESDSEDDIEEEENDNVAIKRIRQLADAVTDLLKRIHQDIETYKGLLDRLGRMGCVTEEENLGMLQAIQDKLYSNENNNDNS